MKKLAIALLMIGSAAKADLAQDFKTMSNNRKGPFTVNWLQHSGGRVGVGPSSTDGCISGGRAGGRFQFQAAFRNASAQKLAAQDFYVGNLFTTNYYALVGEYVFGNPCGSHEDDHRGLLNQAAAAMPKAASMARHWNLEKHYVEYNQASGLNRGFKLRGISDSANEAQYAAFFFNFYLSSMTTDTQFLPAFLLVKESPVGASSQIDKAREIIATSYDYFKVRICGSLEVACSDRRVADLYKLRNAIHNQLSQDVIGEIDKYLKANPWYAREGNTSLQEVQKILRAYYSFTPAKIAEQAAKAGLSDVKALADQVTASGPTVAALLALSQAGANLRTNMAQVPYEKKVYALVTIAVISQYVNKEINKMKSIDSKDVLQALLNTVYMEGFLIKDNWVYFSQELKGAANVKAAGAQLADFAEIAQATLDQAFQPALQQWISIDPKMQSFVDNTIKSSSLNTVSSTAQKLT
jgi:hypothetical protein